MNYTKPEIVSLASTSFAIQGGSKYYDPFEIDSKGMVFLSTAPAYEGDE